MHSLGSAKASPRACLVCSTATSSAHMGLDVCRACAVFYRRTSNVKYRMVCRAGGDNCAIERGFNCRKCRMGRLARIIAKSCGVNCCSSSVSNYSDSSPHSMQPCSSGSSYSSKIGEQPRPLLARVRAAYENLNFARLKCEAIARKSRPSPMNVSTTNDPVFPTTYDTLNHANRLLFASLVEFAMSCFPEFRALPEAEKIVVKFFTAFRTFDNSYRAVKKFDSPNRSVECIWDQKPAIERRMIERLKPTKEEYLAMLVLLFWNTEGLDYNDQLERLSEKYRGQAFAELHHYYRDVRRMYDYASRLGEFCMAISIFEMAPAPKSTGEPKSPPVIQPLRTLDDEFRKRIIDGQQIEKSVASTHSQPNSLPIPLLSPPSSELCSPLPIPSSTPLASSPIPLSTSFLSPAEMYSILLTLPTSLLLETLQSRIALPLETVPNVIRPIPTKVAPLLYQTDQLIRQAQCQPNNLLSLLNTPSLFQ